MNEDTLFAMNTSMSQYLTLTGNKRYLNKSSFIVEIKNGFPVSPSQVESFVAHAKAKGFTLKEKQKEKTWSYGTAMLEYSSRKKLTLTLAADKNSNSDAFIGFIRRSGYKLIGDHHSISMKN